MFRRIGNGLWLVRNNTELVYSPDDGGYYFQQSKVTEIDEQSNLQVRVSKTYRTFDEAKKAYRTGKVEWEDWDTPTFFTEKEGS